MKLRFLIMLALLQFTSCSREVSITPSSWDIGTIGRESIISQGIAIANGDSAPCEVRIVSTCECIFSDKESLTIAPGKEGNAMLYLDPADEEPGNVLKIFFIDLKSRGEEKRITFKITGFIAGD